MAEEKGSPSISIIVPTYNEAKNVQKLLRQVHACMKGYPYEILVMDDNSPDKTAMKAKELEKKIPVRPIIRKKDRGLAKSVVDGFKHARGNFLIVMDADLSHPPKVLPKLIEKQKKSKADIVVASRLVPGGGTENWPRSRKLTSYIAGVLARPLTQIKDPMSGFFLFNKNVIRNVALSPIGYKILLEILVKGNYKKAVEVPFIFRDRTAGQSKLSIKTNMEYLMHLSSLYMHKVKRLCPELRRCHPES
ncbi:polyprenol monophosphomannose synthase [Candidatus Woesearchaeota archaeon]|nr:polyprenol monophosphomannose synthase [Candidatus Woesearchaeota archaeon]